MIFDHPPPPRRPRTTPRTMQVHGSMEELEIDDDQEPLLRPERERGGRPVRGVSLSSNLALPPRLLLMRVS